VPPAPKGLLPSEPRNGGRDFQANPRWRTSARPIDVSANAKWGTFVEQIKAAVERVTSEHLPEPQLTGPYEPVHGFNSVLINRYPGPAGIKWHSDDEKCYGNPLEITIASVSLGSPRFFELRRRPRKGMTLDERLVHRFKLMPGSLLLMTGSMQKNWQHSLPMDAECGGTRINLTFRRVYGDYGDAITALHAAGRVMEKY
jgi:hypothetical protein